MNNGAFLSLSPLKQDPVLAGSGGGGTGVFVAHLDTLNGIMSFPGFCLIEML